MLLLLLLLLLLLILLKLDLQTYLILTLLRPMIMLRVRNHKVAERNTEDLTKCMVYILVSWFCIIFI